MSDRFAEITREALSLPSNERMDMAIMLWESLSDCDRDEGNSVNPEVIAEIRRRDAEMESGMIQGIPFEKVMAEARKAFPCG